MFEKYKLTRREFLKNSALLGGSAVVASQLGWASDALAKMAKGESAYTYDLLKPENHIYSTCLQCHVDCPMVGKILNGVLVKIDGSPYSPQSMLPQIDYGTSPAAAAKVDGKLCPKGLSGIQSLYDPYRVTRVLKRVGPRGSGKWKSLPFAQAVREMTEGGDLFGEGKVQGLKDIYSLRNSKASKEMAKDAKAVGKKRMSLSKFKSKWRKYLYTLIDPSHPDLGPKNNQFVFLAGRIEHGRKELAKRFTKDSFGSVNFFEHTTICEQSHHIAHAQMTNQYKEGKWKGGKHHLKPDLLNAEFVIFWGTGAFEANFGSTPMAEKVTRSLVERNFKFAVVDPRLSKTASKAKYWLPVKPGADAALAMAMVRWIIERGRYNAYYLTSANKAAAKAKGQPTWTNASYLVKIEKGRRGSLLRASEIGLGSKHQFVVRAGGRYIAVTPGDKGAPVNGELFVKDRINGIRVRSAFQILADEAWSKSFEQYAELSGIDGDKIAELADEFTSHGRKAAIDFYRGAVQHTNGYYTAQALITLNLLVGNPDWKGGLSVGGGHWHESGGKEASVYDFKKKKLHPGALKAFGVALSREKAKYEDSTLFKGYPAKRPWYPFSGNVYQEVIPSALDSYPYPIKFLLLQKGTPLLSTPGGTKVLEGLRDPKKIPLFVACDIVIGETSMYADYIIPDLTYLERWGTPHVSPDINSKTSKVRQPLVAPLTEEVKIDGEKLPLSLEAFLLAAGKRLGLTGFGRNGFGGGMDFNRPEDFYLKLVANMAFGDKPGEAVPKAEQKELALFRKARRHLPGSVFDEKKWKKALRPREWERVVYVLNRGGRYAPFETAYQGGYLKHQFGKMFNIYVENVAEARGSVSGRYFSGVANYEPVKDARGNLIADREFDFQLITYKEIFGGHSRTISNYWSNVSIQPENKIWISGEDAEELEIKNDAVLRLTSKSNPAGKVDLGNGKIVEMKARAFVTEMIRPGVVAVSWHYGHWANYGATDFVIDGKRIPVDKRRGTGLVPNPLMREDESVGKVCLTDPIGASASFYDTRVKVERG